MNSLQRIIITRLQWMAILMVILLIPAASTMQVLLLQSQARDNAQAAFHQIEQILTENTQDLEDAQAQYRQTCLHNAEVVAYMIQHNPEILGDIEEFHRIARMMEVDEIHIFNKSGEIFTGSHPEYYGYSVKSGEQIAFFAPLLQDRSLRLCQEVTPNTAEGKMVQYSALWSDDGAFIVQIGMYPSTILEYVEKNELSHIFSLLQGSAGVSLYAVDAHTGIIQGSTSGIENGKHMEEIGLEMDAIPLYRNGALATVSGVDSYCVFTDMDDMMIGFVIAIDTLYDGAPVYTLSLAMCIIVIASIIVALMWLFTRKYIIQSIDLVNHSLSLVSDGNLDERVEVRSSLEFSVLSDRINYMIRSLLASTDKISFILNHTNMRIGVYEYSTKMATVRMTEHIPDILQWSPRTAIALCSDKEQLKKHLEEIRANPVPGEENVFRLNKKQEAYIKLEEVSNGPDTLGIIIDVTEDILTRRQIERERDIDILTGLYTRRAMERALEAAFQQDTGFGALVLIDSDDLKTINDKYGHTVGDWYIKTVADAISRVGTRSHMAARMGGDEFVLLLYDYASEEALRADLYELIYLQKNISLSLSNGIRVPVRFSFGYVMTQGRTDYSAMITEADSQMYEAKRKRKLEPKVVSD